MTASAPDLTLVGLGLEPDGIPLAGREAAREAEHVFLETYTALPPQSIEEIEALVEGEVTPADRALVEDGTEIVDKAEDGGACLLVSGDPLSATTHTALRMQALKRGLGVAVHHAGSILTAAAGAVGLSHYKFGRVTTLVTPREDYFPTSPYDVIATNQAVGLHSLVLLDIRDDGSCMRASEAAKVLLDLEAECGENVLDEDTQAVAAARAGRADEQAWRGPLGALCEIDAGEPMHSLVLPGETSAFEEEALAASCRAP
jgi:diphthine synthase